jgi:hypothetical protein
MAAPTPRQFFDALWSGSNGSVQLTFLRKQEAGRPERKDQYFGWPAGADPMLTRASSEPGWNAYYGIGIRSKQSNLKAYVFAVPALWTTFDLSQISLGKAAELLNAFRFKPSVGIASGRTLQAYWFLEEALDGNESEVLIAANRKLVAAFHGGKSLTDAAADPLLLDLMPASADDDPLALKTEGLDLNYDTTALLPVPGTIDVSGESPLPVKFVAWRLEARYAFEDIVGHLLENKPGRTATAAPKNPPAQAEESRPSPAPPQVGRDLSSDLTQKVADTLRDVWIEGYREKLSLALAGAIAHAGYSEASAARVIRGICSLTADPAEEGHLSAVRLTFEKFASGGAVTGWPTLEKTLEGLPGVVGDNAKKVLKMLKRSVPKEAPPGEDDGDGDGGSNGHYIEPDFEITRIIKFDSRPARYQVIIRKQGEDQEVPCETDVITEIRRFRKSFFEATANRMIAAISQTRWERMLSEAPLEVRAAPEEATLAGAIRTTLETFLEDRKESPELGELKTFPGYSEKEVFFQLRAFKGRLKDAGIKGTDREVTHVLKDAGWKDDRRRISGKNPRLWVKEFKNGDADGAQETPEKPKEPELFDSGAGNRREPGEGG